MAVAIIDYNAGNVRSVLFAMERLGVDAILTDDPTQIRQADKVIFPGVGEASTTMAYLREKGLDEVIRSLQQPVLGVCLGMQLLCEYSEENDTPCLGIIPQQVKRFQATNGEKVPHMGWNSVQTKGNTIFTSALHDAYVYFVHSYYVEIGAHTTATTNYVHPFSAGLQKDNFYATQFHPEKSGAIGEVIIKNFLSI
jgi:glutamine amidotransferase